MLTTATLVLSLLSTLVLSGLILTQGPRRFTLQPSWRELLLVFAVVNGLSLVVITEGLSESGRLTFGWVLGGWALCLGVQVPCWRRMVRDAGRLPSTRSPWTRPEYGLVGAVAFIIVVVGVTGIASAPNNWDSLTYHLSRMEHWRQNGSVEFFPTSNERQLYFPPFAEYALLHVRILTGADRLLAGVQWASFAACLIGISLIAEEFGANRLVQLFAVAFAATVPTAILEASSTQNDLVLTLWLVCFCYFSLRFINTGDSFNASCAAAALGLALLTKATAYLLLPGIAAGFLVQLLRRHGARFLPLMGILLLLAGGVPSAFWGRNIISYRIPIGSRTSPEIRSSASSVSMSVPVALVKSAALHLALPPERFQIPERVKSLVAQLETWTGGATGMPLDGASWRDTLANEDRAGAPLHFLALPLLTAGLLFSLFRRSVPFLAVWLVLASGIGAVVLVGALWWNPWMVRFHLTLFFLVAPCTGLVVSGWKQTRGALFAILVMAIMSSYPLFWNETRPIIGHNSIFLTDRRGQYFAADRNVMRRDAMMSTIDYLNSRHVATLGLRLGDEAFEYLYWVHVAGVTAGKTRICHVSVMNPSRAFPAEPPCVPDAIMVDAAAPESLTISSRQFEVGWSAGPFRVYVPAP